MDIKNINNNNNFLLDRVQIQRNKQISLDLCFQKTQKNLSKWSKTKYRVIHISSSSLEGSQVSQDLGNFQNDVKEIAYRMIRKSSSSR